MGKSSCALIFACISLFSLPAEPSHSQNLPLGFQDELVATGLSQPSSFAFLPDSRVLVVEQATKNLRAIVGGVATDTLLHIADVRGTVGERGLLGLAVDPRWPSPAHVYFYFNRTPGDVIYISRFTASGDLTDPSSINLSFGNRYDILTDIPDNLYEHNGGTLRFGADGMLYASVGDDGDRCSAQDSTSFKGAILRLNVQALPDSGTGPADKALLRPASNPFPGTNLNAGLTYAFGLRNPFRIHVDTSTSEVYVGDVGEGLYEEMNETMGGGGQNFGWPFREGPIVRTQAGCVEPGGSGSQNYDEPIGGYFREGEGANSIIGGPRYRLSASPGGAYNFPANYDGALFFTDYYIGFLRVLEETGSNWSSLPPVPGQPSNEDWGDGFTFIGDWLQGPDGAIYYLKQFPGELRRIIHPGQSGLPNSEAESASLQLSRNPLPPGQSLAIQFEHATPSRARVDVFDIHGKLIKTLMDRESPPGAVTVYWEGVDQHSKQVAAGVYLVSVHADRFKQTKRLVVLGK